MFFWTDTVSSKQTQENKATLKRNTDIDQTCDVKLKKCKTENNCYQLQQKDFDSDDNIEPDLPASLDWRTDPNTNFSDWILSIESNNNNNNTSIQEYHVHKNILSLRSEYFRERLNNTDLSSSNVFTFQLPDKAVVVFPELLDYLYHPDDLKLTTENASAFHYFGNVFGLRHLRWEAKQFWQNDLTTNTVAVYYQDALGLDDKKIVEAVKTASCRDEIFGQFHERSEFLDVPDPQLLLHLVEKLGPAQSEQLSILVAAYCLRHPIDQITFDCMTNKISMPIIAFSAAVDLLRIEQILIVKKNAEKSVLSSLQIRCIDALEKCWDQIDVSSEYISTFLSNQSPEFLAALFKRILIAAQSRHHRSDHSYFPVPNEEANQSVYEKDEPNECIGGAINCATSSGDDVKEDY